MCQHQEIRAGNSFFSVWYPSALTLRLREKMSYAKQCTNLGCVVVVYEIIFQMY